MRRTLSLARGADFALAGIGDLGSDSHMARMGWLGAQELHAAQSDGIAGDLMGYDLFDRDGDGATTASAAASLG